MYINIVSYDGYKVVTHIERLIYIYIENRIQGGDPSKYCDNMQRPIWIDGTGDRRPTV